jgi:hypothetical protein
VSAPEPPVVDAGALFGASDFEQLRARGIAPEEAARQVALLRKPDHYATLDRVCTVGDGIVRLGDAERARFAAAGAAPIAAGRCTRFVPASGAASRMFADLEHFRTRPDTLDARALSAEAAAGGKAAAALLAFLDGLPRFAFFGALAARVAAAGGDAARLAVARDYRPLLVALLGAEGLNAAALPKGLLAFHASDGAVRTAFAEQLAEAALLIADASGRARLHFTVTPEHRAGFEAELEAFRARAPHVRFDATFSAQKASTDTLAAGLDGRPFRLANGALLFRPAGHGALIENLAELGADLVLIKNIDNIVPDRLKGPTLEWSRILAGMLAGIEAEAHGHFRALEGALGAAAVDAAAAFLERAFGATLPDAARDSAARRAAALEGLERPIRICGMVPNTGEPGGGPCFTAGDSGPARPQIVESAQVRMSDPAQARIFRGATHFNPVFLACALRDPHGRPYDLSRFVDPGAVIVTQKSAEGRPLLALERPGLWNGAMARWNSIFVEVPNSVFHPVKTVLDLLRPEHQPESA